MSAAARHPLGFDGVGRERLLAQHVLAGGQGPQGPLGVEPVGQRIVDGVDVLVGQQLGVGPPDHRDVVLGGEYLGPVSVTGGDRPDLDAGQ